MSGAVVVPTNNVNWPNVFTCMALYLAILIIHYFNSLNTTRKLLYSIPYMHINCETAAMLIEMPSLLLRKVFIFT